MAVEELKAAPLPGMGGKCERRRNSVSFGLALLAGLWAGSAGAQVVAAMATVTETVPQIAALYTTEQADFGARTYPQTCGGCHGINMIEIFSLYESGSRFFGFISGSMPGDNPGGLDTEQYLAIMAYLMREMGYPAGDAELTTNREILATITPKGSREALGFAVYDEQYDPGYVPPVGGQP